MGGPEIERLIGLLAKLPGMGPRSARRAALKMLQQPEARMLPLASALAEAAIASTKTGDAVQLWDVATHRPLFRRPAAAGTPGARLLRCGH